MVLIGINLTIEKESLIDNFIGWCFKNVFF